MILLYRTALAVEVVMWFSFTSLPLAVEIAMWFSFIRLPWLKRIRRGAQSLCQELQNKLKSFESLSVVFPAFQEVTMIFQSDFE